MSTNGSATTGGLQKAMGKLRVLPGRQRLVEAGAVGPAMKEQRRVPTGAEDEIVSRPAGAITLDRPGPPLQVKAGSAEHSRRPRGRGQRVLAGQFAGPISVIIIQVRDPLTLGHGQPRASPELFRHGRLAPVVIDHDQLPIGFGLAQDAGDGPRQQWSAITGRQDHRNQRHAASVPARGRGSSHQRAICGVAPREQLPEG